MEDLKIKINDKFTMLDDDYAYASNDLVNFLKGFEEFGDIVSAMIIYKLMHTEEIVIDIKQLEDYFAFFVESVTSIEGDEYEINKKLVRDEFKEVLKELINKGYAESCDG